MKRFLGILVACLFLGSAAYAAERDSKVGFVGEEIDGRFADVESGPAPERIIHDTKVGFVGEEKTTK